MDKYTVCIVGKPNVGKSSLFNRIIKERYAVIEEREGTTRDRIERMVSIKGKHFILIDTGGFIPDQKNDISKMVTMQIKKAVSSSHMLLFVCDATTGLTPLDMDLAHILRKSGKEIVLVVNKIDNETRKDSLVDFYGLGLGEPIAISCIHKAGIKILINRILQKIPFVGTHHCQRSPIKIAIVGKPNTGKSSLLNKIINEERVIVHGKPGTTRDAIDTYFERGGVSFILIDTAGIKHRRNIKQPVEVFSMSRSIKAIKRCDIALLLVDGYEGITMDDIFIFNHIIQNGRGCVIVVNKWDLIKGTEMSRYEKAIFAKVPDSRYYPVIFISAKTGRNVPEVFNIINRVNTNLNICIDKDELKEFFFEIEKTIPVSGRQNIKIYSLVQSKIFPKEFILVVNKPEELDKAILRSFIENRLREHFPLYGVPVKIKFQRRTKRRATR